MTHEEKAQVVNTLIVNYLRLDDEGRDWFNKKVNGWISVKDRLPKNQGHFLVIAPKSFPKNCVMVVAEFYDDNNTFYSESSDCPMPDVTYWMTLPELPTK